MSEETKELVKTVGLLLIRWILKIGAGVFGMLGISTGAIEEVLLGLLMFGVGALISLIQRKKDLAAVPVKIE